jgi:hypothetical protein
MKKSALMIAMVFGVTSAFAQLSTRENDETVIKYGARPKAGDMAFVLGTSLANDSGMTAKLFSGNALQSGNILTYKYYKSDDIVIRAGIRFMNKNLTVKGTGADSTAQYNPNLNPAPYNNLSEVKAKTVERMYEIVPGIEKHFVAANIFDAYVGADLYLGFGSDKSINNYTYKNGDKNFTNRKTNTTNVGLGVITGFNVFLGHLPMSIGLEYGWNAKWTFGGVTKVKEEVQIAGNTAGSYTATYKEEQASNAVGATSAKYSKLKRREFNANTNQDVRIVLHIYFAR